MRNGRTAKVSWSTATSPGSKPSLIRWLAVEIAAALCVFIATDQVLNLALNTARPADYRLFMESRQAFPEDDPPEILVVGDSHIADAYVPRRVYEETGRTSFNFAVYHSGPIEWRILVEDLLASSARAPRLVVIGANPAMFNRVTSGGKYTPEFISDPLLRIGLLRHSGLGDDWLLLLASYRQRDLVPALARRLSGRPPPAPVRLIQDVDHGYLKNLKHMNANEAFQGGSTTDLINPVQLQSFRALLDLLAGRGIEIAVADPPMEPRHLRAVRATAAYWTFDRALAQILIEHGVRRFNFRESELALQLDYRDFLNAEHVCASGAAYFSTFLGAWLRGGEEPTPAVQTRALEARAANACLLAPAAHGR
jgi:hypothetical protein